MQSFTVVEADDVVSNVVCGLSVICVVFLPDPFHFQIQEEMLHHSVIPAVAFSAHATYQPMLFQQRLMRATRVLRTPV